MHLPDAYKSLTKLIGLWLKNTAVTGNGFEYLTTLPALHVIRLNGCPLSDDSLIGLARVPSLYLLDLQATTLTVRAVTAFRANHPELVVTYP